MADRATAPADSSITRRGLLEALTNLGVAALFLLFAYVHVRAFVATGRLSLVVMVAFEALFAVMFVARRAATSHAADLSSWIATLGGTFLPLLLRPVATRPEYVAGEIVQAVAMLFCCWGLLALNRRVGLVAANRGICSSGPYRYVRHPLYVGYLAGQLAYLSNNTSARNVTIVVAAFCCQLVRIRSEEALLGRDPAYRAYAAGTRWKLIPHLY